MAGMAADLQLASQLQRTATVPWPVLVPSYWGRRCWPECLITVTVCQAMLKVMLVFSAFATMPCHHITTIRTHKNVSTRVVNFYAERK